MNYNTLKGIRKNRGMPITELARRSGLSRITISNIEEQKTNPTQKTIAAICKVLEKQPSEIFFTNSVNHEVHNGGNK